MDYINAIKEFIGRHRKAVIISTIVAVLLIVIILLLTVFRPYVTNTGTLYLNIAPHDASITIDGYDFTNNASHTVEAGKHTVRVNKEGFGSQIAEVVVEVGKDTMVSIALKPINEDDTWYVDNPDDDKIYTQVSDQNAEIEQAKFLEKFPIMDHIPYSDTSEDNVLQNGRFKIDAIYSDESISLLVNLNTCSEESAEWYKQVALDWLDSRGVDLSPYDIEFITFCGQTI